MLLLKSLRLEDFLSHEDTKIGFQPDTKVLIDGPSGVGKSAIAEAITWGLYGIARTDNRSLVRRGTKKACVTIELTTGDDDREGRKHYVISRSVQASGKHSLDVRVIGDDGKETAHPTTGLRELQKWLESSLLGASYLLFINSVVYLQGGGDSFVGQTAARRKELLLELVNAENFDEYYEKAREMISEIEAAKTSLEAESERTLEWLGKNRERVSQKSTMQKSLVTTLKSIGVYEDTKKALITTLATMQGSAEQVTQLESATASANYRLITERKEVLRIQSLLPQLEGEVIPTETDIVFAQETEKLRVRLLSSKPAVFLENIRREIEHLKSSAVCSNKDCPHQANVGPKLETLQKELVDGEKMVAEWQSQIDALPASKDIAQMGRILQVSKDVALLPGKEEEVKKLSGELERMAGLLETARKNVDMDAKKQLEDKLEETEGLIRTARASEATFTGELAVIDQLESEISERESIIEKYKVQAIDIAERLKKLLMVKEAFGSKGIKSVVVDYLLPRLEENVNNVLSKLSDFRIRFDTQRATVDGENQVEGLFITIINEMNEEMAFENYSGGERLKITVAISEALAGLQKVGFRIFDEVFVGLDDASTESFARVLDKMQSRFNQVVCISHLGAIKAEFDSVITVRKDSGISTIC